MQTARLQLFHVNRKRQVNANLYQAIILLLCCSIQIYGGF